MECRRAVFLAPIRFIIYINDLPEVVSSTVNFFVYDKIYNNDTNSDILQQDLDALFVWSKLRQLCFNVILIVRLFTSVETIKTISILCLLKT